MHPPKGVLSISCPHLTQTLRVLRNLDQVVYALDKAGLVQPGLGKLTGRVKAFPKTHESRRRCMWPGCSGRPVDSHVISKCFLGALAPDGRKLRSPSNPEVFVMQAKARRIGLEAPKNASTFRGFCGIHDTKEFASFENARRMRSKDDFRRQLIRTVSLEHQNREDLIHFLELVRHKKSGVGSLSAALGLEGMLGKTRKHFALLDRMLTDLHTDLAGVEEEIHIYHQVVRPGLEVALSYVDFFPIVGVPGETEVPIALAIIPQWDQGFTSLGSSLLLVASPRADAVAGYVQRYLTPPTQALATTAKWLTDGCFSWWACQEWWDGLPPNTREAVEDRLVRFGHTHPS